MSGWMPPGNRGTRHCDTAHLVMSQGLYQALQLTSSSHHGCRWLQCWSLFLKRENCGRVVPASYKPRFESWQLDVGTQTDRGPLTKSCPNGHSAPAICFTMTSHWEHVLLGAGHVTHVFPLSPMTTLLSYHTLIIHMQEEDSESTISTDIYLVFFKNLC